MKKVLAFLIIISFTFSVFAAGDVVSNGKEILSTMKSAIEASDKIEEYLEQEQGKSNQLPGYFLIRFLAKQVGNLNKINVLGVGAWHQERVW